MNVPKLQMHKQAPMKRNEVLVNRVCGNIRQEALPGMSIKRLLGAIALLLGLNSSAQDLHFSQFFEAPLLRNPSLAGIFAGDFRAQMVYRNQWASVTTPYQTASLNSEYKFPVGR